MINVKILNDRAFKILIRNYLDKCRNLDALGNDETNSEEEEELPDIDEREVTRMRDAMKENEATILDIICMMNLQFFDSSFYSEYEDDLKSALMRCSHPSNHDGPVHSESITSLEDRTKRIQREHDLILSTYRSMNPNSSDADFDIEVMIGGFTFKCHTHILSAQSEFFARQISDSGSKVLEIPNVDPDTFIVMLRYIYNQQFYPVSLENLFQLTHAAADLSLSEFARRCAEFLMERKLFVNLVHDFRYIALSQFSSRIDIQDIVDHVRLWNALHPIAMFYLLSSEQLQVNRETDVSDLIVEWLNRIGWLRYTFEGGFGLMSMLLCVRWSSVPEEYVRTKLLSNKHIKGTLDANKFITTLLDCYYAHAIPIRLQRTFIRPSLGYEKCFMSFEKGQLGNFRVTMRRIQEFPCQSYMGGLGVNSFELSDSISGAVYREVTGGRDSWPRDALYLTGTGKRFKGILKYEISTGWSKCSDMVMDRKHHRSVFVGSKLFSCGGVARCTIEEFDINTNKPKMRRSELELLDHPVCVAHRTCIYFFGGSKDNVCTDRVYSYDTVNDTIVLFEKPMPVCVSGFVPVVYKGLIILLHEKTCLIYDVKSWLWITKDAYRTNIRIFAARGV